MRNIKSIISIVLACCLLITAVGLTSTATVKILCDINADEAVNAKDVLRLKQYLAQWKVDIDADCADCNRDNTVNAKDLLIVRQALADIIPLPTFAESTTKAQSSASIAKEQISVQDGSTLSYWLYTPENAATDMPLLIYLHGGSGKGDDLDILMQNDGFPKALKDGALGAVPAYVVIPQVSSSFKGWSDIKNSVRELANYCITAYSVNADKINLTGHSMGGTGAWSLAVAFPELFSCVAPLSGSITVNNTYINALANLPVWAFVGSADRIVNSDSSIQFISELKKVNSNAQITVFEGADHFSVPTLTYLDKNLNVIQWLIFQSK